MRRLWLLPLVGLAAVLVGWSIAPSPAAEPDDITSLVAKLGDRDYRTREQATKTLAAKGWEAVPAMEKALAAAEEPEVIVRLQRVIHGITRLDWHTKPDDAVAVAKKTGRPILIFSTIGDVNGFA